MSAHPCNNFCTHFLVANRAAEACTILLRCILQFPAKNYWLVLLRRWTYHCSWSQTNFSRYPGHLGSTLPLGAGTLRAYAVVGAEAQRPQPRQAAPRKGEKFVLWVMVCMKPWSHMEITCMLHSGGCSFLLKKKKKIASNTPHLFLLCPASLTSKGVTYRPHTAASSRKQPPHSHCEKHCEKPQARPPLLLYQHAPVTQVFTSGTYARKSPFCYHSSASSFNSHEPWETSREAEVELKKYKSEALGRKSLEKEKSIPRP